MTGSDGSGTGTPGTVQETVAHLRGGGRGWVLLFIAASWLFISGFRVVLPALLPGIKADFAIDNTAAGVALTVLWGIYAVLQFPTGLAADRTGERPWLVAGALLAALSFVGFYVAPVYGVFLLACAVFGVSAGLFGTPRDMLLTKTYPTADNTAYSLTFAAGSLGAASLPFVAVAIAARFDWRAAVIWLLPPLLVAGFGLWRVVPRTGTPAVDRLRARETARRTVAALSEPRVRLAAAAMLLYVFTYQGVVSFLPTYLVEVKGLSPGLAAALFGVLFVVGAVVQPVAGTYGDRFGVRGTVLVLIALSTVSLGALPFVGGVAVLAVVVPLVGIRIAVGPLTSAFIVRSLPEPVKGAGWGLLRTVFFGLGATGSTVIGVFGDAGRFDAGFLIMAVLTGVTAILWWRLPPA